MTSWSKKNGATRGAEENNVKRHKENKKQRIKTKNET